MPLRTRSGPAAGQSWFLGIGIDAYESFPRLSNAVKDMHDVRALMSSKYDVDADLVRTLENEQATEENIILELERLADEVQPDDKLLIYYSGHGYLNDKTGLAYWIPVDAREGKSADFVANSTIRDHLEAIKARHILLISDSCFSGSLFIKGGTRSSRAAVELANTPSRWALCSGRGNEEVEDGAPGTNSPFAVSVLEALEDNNDPLWNVSRLVERVREQTAASANQLPEGNPLRLRGHKGGQYVFTMAGQTSQSTHDSTSEVQRTRTRSDSRRIAGRSRQKPASNARRIVLMVMALIIMAILGYYATTLKAVVPVVDISATTFHTTSAVNENVWPADQRASFQTDDRVYAYGLLWAEGDTRVDSCMARRRRKVKSRASQKRYSRAPTDPFRFSSYKIFRTPGTIHSFK